MGHYIFIVSSVIVSLYAAYLLAYRLYKVDYCGDLAGRVVFPRIVYVAALATAFVPMLNTAFVIVFMIFLVINSDEYRVKSWLFEKPKMKDRTTMTEEDKNPKNKHYE